MSILKLIGTLALLSVGSFFAIGNVQTEKRKLSVLDAWIDLISTVHREIDCYLRPIDEILDAVPRSLRRACTAGGDGNTLDLLLKRARPYLDAETLRLLERFVRELGNTYREEELRLCDFYVRALRSRRDVIAAEHPMRIKLGVTLALCTALGAIILLW